MDTTELQGIIGQRFSCKIQKDEVVVETCVFCGNDRWNLELQPEYGVYHCWACKAAGTLRTFLADWMNLTVHLPVTYAGPNISYTVPKDHFDIETEPIEGIGTARQYLERRGITLAEMMQHDIRFCREEAYENRIMLPAREYWTQRLFGYVARAYLPYQKPKYMATFRSPMIAGLRHFRNTVHIIVEGLLDAIAVHRAGFNAAAMLGGASGSVLFDAWAARVPPEHTIIVLLDGDAEEKAQALEWRVKGLREKVGRFTLPEHMDPAMLESQTVRALVDTVMQQGGWI